VSTVRKSFIALVYREDIHYNDDGNSPDGIEKYFGDIQGRQTSTHLVLDIQNKQQVTHSSVNTETSRIVLVADLDGGLTVLSHPSKHDPNRSHRISRAPIIQTTLSRFLSRLAIAPARPSFLTSSQRSSRRKIWPLANSQDSPPPPFASNAFIGPDIVGSSPSGALIHLHILTRQAAELLKYLENLVSWATLGSESPSSGSVLPITIDPMRRVAVGMAQAGFWPDDMAVNGDKLVPFAVDGGIQVLEGILDTQEWELTLGRDEKAHSYRTGNDVVGRMSRFITLVDGVLGPDDTESIEYDNGDDMIQDDDEMGNENIDALSQKLREKVTIACTRCVLWLEEVLSDIL
jgi:hypothetical protein